METRIEDVETLLGQCLARDQAVLRRRLKGVRRLLREGRPVEPALTAIRRDAERSSAVRAARRQLLPALAFPPELPVSARREEIARAIVDHQVVIVCGETGSGKTTQLPKICLELGRGVDGQIGHTQPRRIAARSVATRIAEELGTAPGSVVGWQVRFDQQGGDRSLVKVMTDGILLAELARDPQLRRYDTIILDEAHERSLNIDLLLGCLKRILPARPDLRVIVTSATLEPRRFSAHFNGAPVIEVSGRTHPVEIRWRPPQAPPDGGEPALADAVVAAVEECLSEPGTPDGDLLVFLAGEREILECAEALRGAASTRGLELLPLFGRLGADEQDRVFTPGARRRAVLATNVAETSLTVPRIRFVVDGGTARMARYSGRSRVQRLLVEPISQASAAQRAGRCGRLGPGICIRLWDEASHAERPEFTAPEILRADLAGVALRMRAFGLGPPEDFPFLDHPSPRLWQDAHETLVEIGAVDRRGEITPLGRRMAELPVDPRAARMILASIDGRCLEEVLVIAAALSVQDPRERPSADASAADMAHAAFRHPDSDFMGFLSLWRAWCDAQATMGSGALRRWCRERYLSRRRLREWSEIHAQLRRLVQERAGRVEPRLADEPDAVAIHRALLAGLAAHVGRRDDDGLYRGPSGPPFGIHPSSTLARKQPTWIVAAEIVDTGRRLARTVARIQGDWLERVAPHLLQRTHSEPHWLVEAGQAAAWEKVMWGQLVIVPRRRVPYAPIDPAGARDLLIHAALVEEQLRGDPPFLAHNRALRERIEALERKRRRSGLLAGIESRYRFYDARIPPECVNVPSFERWRRAAEARDPRCLFMEERHLLAEGADPGQAELPNLLPTPAGDLSLGYHHEPGAERDGITTQVPLEALERLDAEPFEWLVPGLLAEKVEALLRTLPKRLRTRFFPLQEFALGAAETLAAERGAGEAGGSLRGRLAVHLTRLAGAPVEPADFDESQVPEHLRMRFEVVDEEGRVLGAGRDLAELQRRFRAEAQRGFADAVRAAGAGLVREGLRSWEWGALPHQVDLGSRRAPAWLGVEDRGDAVATRLFPSAAAAAEATRLGLRRLVLLELGDAISHHVEYHPEFEALAAACAPASRAEVLAGACGAAAEAACLQRVPPASAAEFDARLLAAAPALHAAVSHTLPLFRRVQSAWAEIERIVAGGTPSSWAEAVRAIREHAAGLAGASAWRQPFERWPLLAAALECDLERLRRLPRGGAARDAELSARVAPWVHRASAALAAHPPGAPREAEAVAFSWLVEAFRVECFSPGLARPPRVGEAGLERAWRVLG